MLEAYPVCLKSKRCSLAFVGPRIAKQIPEELVDRTSRRRGIEEARKEQGGGTFPGSNSEGMCRVKDGIYKECEMPT